MDNERGLIKELYKQLIDSESLFFPEEGKMNIIDRQGVYVILSPEEDIVIHVGNTPYGKFGLNQRLYNHISKTGILYREYLRVNKINLRNGYKFKFLIVDSPRLRALLEAYSAGMLCPVYFGTGERKMK